MWTSLQIYLLLLSVDSSAEARSPRMLLSHKETAAKGLPLPGHQAPVQVILGKMDNVISVGRTHVNVFNSQNPEQSPVEKKLVLKPCSSKVDKGCDYSVRVVHRRDEAELFVCGNNGQETKCCDVNVTLDSPVCVSEKLQHINDKIWNFEIKEGEHSVVAESPGATELYVTFSGAQGSVGLHKFGAARVRPANHDKEEYYVGLTLSRRPDDPLQDRVYAFFKQKNRDRELYSEMWLPFVSQVCMSDVGGPKNNLQSCWTSQMKARLFCGDPETRQHFSELVDVATVHADAWQEAKVYALFRNEWGMSAMCMYAIGDIDDIFSTSPFKDSTPGKPMERPRTCVSDSTKLPSDVLGSVQRASEMERWVMPVSNSHPLLVSHHNYTHIHVDASHPHTVIFLSLDDGRIHKVVRSENRSFTIAEFTPFQQSAHVVGLALHPPTKTLYVSTRSELVQLDVGNCGHYGNSCQDCILSRDPYCGWSHARCSRHTGNSHQDVTRGDPAVCTQALYLNKAFQEEHAVIREEPVQSKFFLCCPVRSRHARYSWETAGGGRVNCSYMEEECLLQIDGMSPAQQGRYRCVSEERGYRKVLAQYELQMSSAVAGPTSSTAVWACTVAMAVLITRLCS
ncbi:semaphorin-7A-like [Cololabis saira]|uniref:semaphorin-7A-like n=1 Tax=Cololabis saira TaxID=129043 RepID=UPI002AD46535|nr:semaphorin-7A-like [Cololabis saira]